MGIAVRQVLSNNGVAAYIIPSEKAIWLCAHYPPSSVDSPNYLFAFYANEKTAFLNYDA